ncbi:glycoside hydrolase family 88/105 protein [Paenibacillus agaridevorans]|uniref:glycoside hydrolase family 88/105 protein n=1 Tax=Paenibacillus agaridevorans TaxID=171404 RepID=UPI001BE4C390|nr:glycoside hydrolase family 88 protein [Paenibacillus agaridevorans]
MKECFALLNRLAKGTLDMDLYSYDPGAGLKGIIPEDDLFWHRKRNTWDWGQGVAWVGMMAANEWLNDPLIDAAVQEFVIKHMEDGLPPITVNSTIPYLLMIQLYRKTGEQTYLRHVIAAADYCMNEADRTSDGLWVHTTLHFDFPQEVWVDTMFMAGLFLMKVSEVTGNSAYAKEAAFQINGHVQALYDEEHSLFYHAIRAEEQRPISDVHWGRGTSWATIIMIEALTAGILEQAAHESVKEIFKAHTEKLVQLQDITGLWHTVLDQEQTYLESSCSAGFAYAILRGLKANLLEGSHYEQAVERTFTAFGHYIDGGGRLFSCSAGTAAHPHADLYIAIPNSYIQPWGQGLALLFIQEFCKGRRS